jgi:ribosomal protein S18 acetylase RimI-like enzyme
MEYRRYQPSDLVGVLRLCEQEEWPSFPEDPARANRALTAPGVTTLVALEAEQVVGFAQIQSDGEVQAHLSLIAVDAKRRREGVARELIVRGLRQAGGQRMDLVTDEADGFYASMPHFKMSGFRLYPEYSGPDHARPNITWRGGRVSG